MYIHVHLCTFVVLTCSMDEAKVQDKFLNGESRVRFHNVGVDSSNYMKPEARWRMMTLERIASWLQLEQVRCGAHLQRSAH